MNGELRDRLLLGVGAVVAVEISYSLYTELRDKTTEGIREAVSRPPDVPAMKVPTIHGLEAGKFKYLDPKATAVKLNGPVVTPWSGRP
ncbi:MAG: hypothetical protein K2X87_13505 [Gemmataceae bacterium]|nr:hypothetical protein [Gemmataceae bacterium]